MSSTSCSCSSAPGSIHNYRLDLLLSAHRPLDAIIHIGPNFTTANVYIFLSSAAPTANVQPTICHLASNPVANVESTVTVSRMEQILDAFDGAVQPTAIATKVAVPLNLKEPNFPLVIGR